MSDKAALAGEVAKLEMQVKQLERDVSNAKSTVTGGAVGLIIGLIGLIVFWPVGVFFLLAGVLAYFTGKGNQSAKTSLLQETEQKLAVAKAQLMAL